MLKKLKKEIGKGRDHNRCVISWCVLVSCDGQWSPDGFFLRAYKIKSVLSVYAQMIFKILGFLVPEKKK
jgi:hypothetical protein